MTAQAVLLSVIGSLITEVTIMKCKHPLVKRLRKAGMSTREAVKVAKAAGDNFKAQRPDDSLINLNFNHYGFGGMFSFSETPEGFNYWAILDNRGLI